VLSQLKKRLCIRARDPAVLAGVILTMLLLGLLAGYVPARRALVI
jgi:ABC-type lipoprotein release transport system permease subunit